MELSAYISTRAFEGIAITMSVVAFLLFFADKLLAMNGRRRVPERLLLSAGALMGAFGCLSAMVLFNHKVRKASFYICIPVLLALQIALYGYLRLH